MKKNPVILSSERDGAIVRLRFIDGKDYKLQHPGYRTWLEWQKDVVKIGGGVDMAELLDNAFEHCVFPEGHDYKPNLDCPKLKPQEAEVWQRTLLLFLRGEISAPRSFGELEEAPTGASSGMDKEASTGASAKNKG